MKKISTVRANRNMIFKGHKLTIGVDLGDRWSCYCVFDEAGEVILEQKLPTTPEAMKQTFGKIAPESSTPDLHRTTIAQQRVRMEGWRQRWLDAQPRCLFAQRV